MMRSDFAVLLALVCLSAAPAWAADATHGDISGTLVYDGTPPAPMAEAVTKDAEVCGKHPLMKEELVVGKEGGIRDIVITLFIPIGGKAPAPHPSYAASANDEVRFDNIGCRFEPHVALLRTTQMLVLGNKDPIAHNSAINATKNNPINPLLPANSDLKVAFKQPERLPVKVACSIHPWMAGWVVVSDNPYSAVTDAQGKFLIKNVPAGQHTFRAWHAIDGYVEDVTEGGMAKKWALGKFVVNVQPNKVFELGTVKVSAKEFVPK